MNCRRWAAIGTGIRLSSKTARTRCGVSRSSPGTGRRRRWSTDAKGAIAAESFAPGASASAVARRHDIHPKPVVSGAWSNDAGEGRGAGDVPPSFLPAVITGCGGKLPSCEEQAAIDRGRRGSHPCQGRVDRRALCEVLAQSGRWPMIGVRPGLPIWIATQPVDFRRGVDSPAMLASEALEPMRPTATCCCSGIERPSATVRRQSSPPDQFDGRASGTSCASLVSSWISSPITRSVTSCRDLQRVLQLGELRQQNFVDKASWRTDHHRLASLAVVTKRPQPEPAAKRGIGAATIGQEVRIAPRSADRGEPAPRPGHAPAVAQLPPQGAQQQFRHPRTTPRSSEASRVAATRWTFRGPRCPPPTRDHPIITQRKPQSPRSGNPKPVKAGTVILP